eukprot:CAMPEP_0177781532 /NCGR_PEP_ID=MMETSP0491_2-20121128/17913_1 /TAXON_ID=63592 /ORGANISM="Tetraselmis chuii, Strain PLY429" /LENGTH=30 /DNA_ID= /DNA_START= /DNA_END= /DNA_ORIENTATION=
MPEGVSEFIPTILGIAAFQLQRMCMMSHKI